MYESEYEYDCEKCDEHQKIKASSLKLIVQETLCRRCKKEIEDAEWNRGLALHDFYPEIKKAGYEPIYRVRGGPRMPEHMPPEPVCRKCGLKKSAARARGLDPKPFGPCGGQSL